VRGAPGDDEGAQPESARALVGANQPPHLREDVPDVEVAALAIEHGLMLASHDRGFRRFSGLRVTDPLQIQ
jgi:predicted nucleic acid-binding protein